MIAKENHQIKSLNIIIYKTIVRKKSPFKKKQCCMLAIVKWRLLENLVIDPGTFRTLSGRSAI